MYVRSLDSLELINKIMASKLSTWSTYYVLGWTLLREMGRRRAVYWSCTPYITLTLEVHITNARDSHACTEPYNLILTYVQTRGLMSS